MTRIYLDSGIYDVKEQGVITTQVSIRGEQYLLGLICIYSWLTPIHEEFIQLFPSLTLLSPLSLLFQNEDQDPDLLAALPGGSGGQRGLPPGAGQPGAAGDEGDGQLSSRESDHLGLSHTRFDLNSLLGSQHSLSIH